MKKSLVALALALVAGVSFAGFSYPPNPPVVPPPSPQFLGTPVVVSTPLYWVDANKKVIGRATGPQNRDVLINFAATTGVPAMMMQFSMTYAPNITWQIGYFIYVGNQCSGTVLGLGGSNTGVVDANPAKIYTIVKEGSKYNLYRAGDATVAPYGNGQEYAYFDSYLQACMVTNYIGYYPITGGPLNLSGIWTPPFSLQ
jgi:hypothetical protein